MLIIPGTSALSEFRREKIFARIKRRIHSCTSIEARYYYFAEEADSLTADQRGLVNQLLNVDGNLDALGEHAKKGDHDLIRYVVPRVGTISPWSTKATDIFHLCGLTQINRVERGVQWRLCGLQESDFQEIAGEICDPMTESVLQIVEDAENLFNTSEPARLIIIDLLQGGVEALAAANQEHGFALSPQEQDYLVESFVEMGRNPTDVELMMFAQVNSEHCRHKIFNAEWKIDGEKKDKSLFSMIRNTHHHQNDGTLVAYSDNAAILEGSVAHRLAPDKNSRKYNYIEEPVHFSAKVETHNHPTAISPFPGASTGSGGEIRDEGATGRGGKPKAGLVGYSVSHLRIPDLPQPWEFPENKPDRIASPLQIMTEGPLGAAAFNNEFGRPNICGYFRSYEQQSSVAGERYGYHKPIMLAGGLGNVRPGHVKKKPIPDGTPIVVLGGPTMLIGLGGGAASSVASGSSSASLDFASVQRGNPEMQRRCQEVIDTCCAMGEKNPIVSIHDVGAGGVCNALPELVHDSDSGGVFELRNMLNDEPGMSPMQIWCNESQERYVLAIEKDRFAEFEEICNRERCLYAQVGIAIADSRLELTDAHFDSPDAGKIDSVKPIDLPMEVLFGLSPKMYRNAKTEGSIKRDFDSSGISMEEAVHRVLGFPTVGDKTFLITIGDRSVTGLIARDQMVGPWQVPVSDVAVTCSGYRGLSGEAFAIGERTPIACIDGPASGRMAIGESITNIVAANIGDIKKIKLSANWMVAAGEAGHDAQLYETVRSIGMDLCPELGISIPVGKDSMSMKTVWNDVENGIEQKVVSPLSLVVSAFAAVGDVSKTVTPVLEKIDTPTDLWLIDLGDDQNRMGGSVLAQVYNQIGSQAPDLDNATLIKQFFSFVQNLNQRQHLLAYHDRSDGGLITTLLEMAFASRCGLSIDLVDLEGSDLEILFNEELGAVIQTLSADRESIIEQANAFGIDKNLCFLGNPAPGNLIKIYRNDLPVYSSKRERCHQSWSQTTWQMQRLRDNPKCADQEYQRLSDLKDPGLFCQLSFEHNERVSDNITRNQISSANIAKTRPKVAILREQGVNGQLEMAAAFDSVGFDAIDVTTTDLINGFSLDNFHGLAACGGFSFGDVLGAGEGWAKSILYNEMLKESFQEFFNRHDTFALGVCNGCQMMSSIKDIIPGASHWPKFLRNASEQYEARFVMVEVCSEKSILFQDMKGSKIPVSTAHGEGRSVFAESADRDLLERNDQIGLRFVDNQGEVTETYPLNPNGSERGLTGFTNEDGRFTIMMPHPERIFRTVSNSWHPENWGEYSPWIKIFQNARNWVN